MLHFTLTALSENVRILQLLSAYPFYKRLNLLFFYVLVAFLIAAKTCAQILLTGHFRKTL